MLGCTLDSVKLSERIKVFLFLIGGNRETSRNNKNGRKVFLNYLPLYLFWFQSEFQRGEPESTSRFSAETIHHIIRLGDIMHVIEFAALLNIPQKSAQVAALILLRHIEFQLHSNFASNRLCFSLLCKDKLGNLASLKVFLKWNFQF